MLLSANKLVVEITIGFVLSLLLKQNEEKKKSAAAERGILIYVAKGALLEF